MRAYQSLPPPPSCKDGGAWEGQNRAVIPRCAVVTAVVGERACARLVSRWDRTSGSRVVVGLELALIASARSRVGEEGESRPTTHSPGFARTYPPRPRSG